MVSFLKIGGMKAILCLGPVNEILPISFNILHPSWIKVSKGGVHKSYRVIVSFVQIGAAVTAILYDGV
jgi:hypothetical protein